MNRPLAFLMMIASGLLLGGCLDIGDTRQIYGLQSWTLNDATCEVEGASVGATDTRFAVNPDDKPLLLGGGKVATVATCGLSDCLDRTEYGSTAGWTLDEISSVAYHRDVILAGTDACTGIVESQDLALLNKSEPRTFRMELKRYAYALTGPCTDAEIRSAALASACTSLEVLKGPFERSESEPTGGSSDDFDDD